MRKKTAVIVISFLSAAVVALGAATIINSRKAESLEYYTRAATQRAFEQLVSDMDDLSTNLEKCAYVSDPALQAALCAQVYGKALEAERALSSLPYEARSLTQAAGFVSRVGDYACVLVKSVGKQGSYSDGELENIQSLSETADVLSGNLRQLQMQVNNGTMRYDVALLADAAEDNTVLLSDSLAEIENEFPELPTLIYDGPFSDGIRRDDPLYLRGKSEIDETTAREAAAEILGVNVSTVKSAGDCGGDVPLWCITASLSGAEYFVSVTKQGGEIWSLLSSHGVGKQSYSAEEGLKIAEDVIERLGFEKMEASYHIIQNGVLTVNFEYSADEIIYYPDLIKVGIALDNGTLQSYDASGYISAHTERQMESPPITADEASSGIADALTIEQCRLAVIPTEGGEERLCYELLCKTNSDRHCLIYRNAQTGAEEKILILLEDEEGTLTI